MTPPFRRLACLTAVMVLCVTAVTTRGEKITDSYRLDQIATPEGLAPQVGGVTFLPDGRLAACFHRGELYLYEPGVGRWTLFAKGLHNPLGLVALDNQSLAVLQLTELTRVSDTDGDGVADDFAVISDDFGVTGNYHEFPFGPAVDKEGNYYISLGHASTGNNMGEYIKHEVRGERHVPSYSTNTKYAAVPWRGWVLKIASDGTTTPYASGFREPNGIGFDGEGRLFVADNQGDYVGSSKLFHVEENRFYGHPASLVWGDQFDFKGDPYKIPIEELDTVRTRAAVVFPHGSMANSPTEPLLIETGGRFGPFEGQMLIGEMNQPRIIRLMLEEVDGVVQGACVPFFDGPPMRMGANRMSFGPDGSLWIGHTERVGKWIGGNGMSHITFTGRVPMEVKTMSLKRDGFELTFTRPVDAEVAGDPANWPLKRYYYKYHQDYGSDQFDLQDVKAPAVEVSADGLSVRLKLDEVKAGYIYELSASGITDRNGNGVVNGFVCYTVNRLRQ
ncbi:MAG: DUF7133 domain-containing protein [Planctomycetota bacterium]